MLNPVSTYRIQFHKGFTFRHLEQVLPYLQKLGLKTIYASPIFEATPGSTHGYDSLNPHRINPEVGTLDELYALSKKLREMGISWLQDIVPNHMAFDGRNPWLMDVLEKGRRSVYASFFDVDWNSPVYQGRIMVPFLGAPVEEVIKKEEIKIAYSDQRFVLKYYDSSYPVSLDTYKAVLTLHKEDTPDAVNKFLQQLNKTAREHDPETYAKLFQKLMGQLSGMMEQEPLRALVEKNLKQINADLKRLLRIVNEQVYRLCHWQETDRQINFRRFFTVNGLICLNIHDKAVFDTYHQSIATLLKEGVFQGLRVDHIDGLYDPTQYLERLRGLAGDETYIVVEKILEPHEGLPTAWPVQGNTGYDFLSIVNNLLTNPTAKKVLTQYYYALVGDHRTVPQQIRDAKAYILYEHMGGELENLYRLCLDLNLADAAQLEALPEGTLKKAIGEFLVHCPVYRYYGNALPLVPEEAATVQDILNIIRQTELDLADTVSVLEDIFLKNPYGRDEDYNNRATHFYQRCMQFSGPLMAKGVEDTVMYTFNRAIAHNEVGDAPDAFGISIDAFHKQMKARQQDWPLSINATATHDTKRGEDFRARLNVLTDLPGVWLETVEHWIELNAALKKENKPDINDEYFIYQTLAGSYLESEDGEGYRNRLQEYLQKALREAKQHSNWTIPNGAYEKTTKDFAVKLLDKHQPFWKSFQKLHHKIRDFGIINSLVQVLLKFTCPGVPDVYQGCERWDFSFVDPDNRRPVDYEYLKKSLDAVSETDEIEEVLQQLWSMRADARIKTWLVHRLLQLRTAHADLFAYGDYIPLQTEGRYKEHVLAFARRYKLEWVIVIVPLHLAALLHREDKSELEPDWSDTMVVLPKEVAPEWSDLLRGGTGKNERGIRVADVFGPVPFAVLRLTGTDKKRSAGILLHITSLPSAFGIGDLGPEAIRFADFLHRTRQRYWQLLPINPTEGGQGHSPYSSTSSRAGNVLLISPEALVRDGLLTHDFIEQYRLPVESKTDYALAERVKTDVFQKAWERFQEGHGSNLQTDLERFKKEEQEWLPDFALYTVLKQHHKGKPWYEWPVPYKEREPEALQTFSKAHAEEIEKQQWLQLLFARQWHALKSYCNARNIRLLGDLPIYVSYDSVDVWGNKELFKLDKEGGRLGLAGVPPDAFSDDGQLWGMPVYNWTVLKERNYDWWVERLRKNSQLFDVIRLDHFRAFADYWEVPAGEETAKNGEWKEGPGADFFTSVKEQLGDLPFVAEDLGEINDAVIQLRDAFRLPGMKILQFAFGGNFQTSDYIPHNYEPNFIAYTGTHDNNTTRGWFRQEADAEVRLHLEQYMAQPVTEANVAHLLCRLAHASIAQTAILPMQDVLELDETARMNTPASGTANWAWRLKPGQITRHAEQQLRLWTRLYNRE
jgi:malto-oligosyltrehalose synthase/4-alpha-glucanotransferase